MRSFLTPRTGTSKSQRYGHLEPLRISPDPNRHNVDWKGCLTDAWHRCSNDTTNAHSLGRGCPILLEDNLAVEVAVLIESGGDNLAATFSPEFADITIYVIDVAAGDKITRKGGPFY